MHQAGGLHMLDIEVLNHIMVCENKYYSFADQGSI
jgi:DNA repair protein RadC